MECKYCKLTNQDPGFIFETQLWNIFLSFNQAYLGRCFIVLKRHCESLSKLTKDEFDDFNSLIQICESALKKAFNAEMFNWNCFMNDAYKEAPPKPHVHWHFRARYKEKVEFAGEVFEDPEFGHCFDRTKKRESSSEAQKKIIKKIRECLPQSL